MVFAIDTAAKRARLAPRKNPYWVSIAGGRGGVSLGYRCRERGTGSWVAKAIIDGGRIEERIGLADDVDAPAEAMGYRVAVALALDWSSQQRVAFEAAGERNRKAGVPTVRTAVEVYFVARAKRSKAGGANAKSRLTRHVLSDGEFASTRLSRLRSGGIEEWRDRLTAPPTQGQDEEAVAGEMTPSNLNRLLNDLRAALNASALKHRRELPANVFQEIKIGTKAVEAVSNARRQLLSDEQVRAVVEAAFEVDESGDFGRLTALLAATGARHSQAAALDVVDLQPAHGRVMMPGSKKGRNWATKAPVPVPLSLDVIGRLLPAIEGRGPGEPLLERWSFKRTGKSTWSRDARRRWGSAHEIDKWWPATVERAGVPADTVTYALRHSSIVRCLKSMLPVRLVAALHDTSVEMIEKHYAAFIVDVTEDLARRAVLSITNEENILRAA